MLRLVPTRPTTSPYQRLERFLWYTVHEQDRRFGRSLVGLQLGLDETRLLGSVDMDITRACAVGLKDRKRVAIETF